MKRLLFIFLASIITSAAVAQQNQTLRGNWKGAIELPQNALPIQTHFQQKDSSLTGTIDIQGTSVPLQNIRTTETDSVFFHFTTNFNVATFKGEFESQEKITGQYLQAGHQFPFTLTRNLKQEDTSNTTVNYQQQELIIPNGDIDIGGTLTHPEDQSTDQLVIMSSGSGAQDRDASMAPIISFKPFALLADSLTTNGIATFRYDDRGVGASTGNFRDATLDDLASDVEAIIDYFKNKSDHQFDKIILLGHSQGGIVGGKVAARNDQVDKLILMASSGLPLKKLLRYQIKQAFMQANIDSSLVNREIEAREKLMQAIRDDINIQRAKQDYQQRFAAIQRSAGVDSAHASILAKQQAKQLTDQFSTLQLQSLLFYDPTNDLSNLNIPVLALFGGKDTQVPIETNQSPIRQALEKADISCRIKVFNQANHLFQKAETGQASEYGLLDDTFVNGFTSTISQWIKGQP